jgi:hypothetical protein
VVSTRGFAATTVSLGVLTLAHAALSWPPVATLALFGGGILVAFLAEALVVNLGWLEHHIRPRVLGVPLYVLAGWPAAIYIAFRLALLATGEWAAVLTAAALATGYDLLTDHQGVGDGHWTYRDDLPGPRFRGVPWWNYVGWFLISTLTAGFALPWL